MQGKSPYLLSTTSYLILQWPGNSVVEHLVYVQEVLGSNPSQATSFQGHMILNMEITKIILDFVHQTHKRKAKKMAGEQVMKCEFSELTTFLPHDISKMVFQHCFFFLLLLNWRVIFDATTVISSTESTLH
jgi:hypothetical protein